MTYREKNERLRVLRQNMANKMVAGVDYEKEADEIVRITAELKAVDNTMVKIYE